jgi:hypothetical protein
MSTLQRTADQTREGASSARSTRSGTATSLAGFPLFDAITGRRARRFGLGMEIPSGPLAYRSPPIRSLSRRPTVAPHGGRHRGHGLELRGSLRARPARGARPLHRALHRPHGADRRRDRDTGPLHDRRLGHLPDQHARPAARPDPRGRRRPRPRTRGHGRGLPGPDRAARRAPPRPACSATAHARAEHLDGERSRFHPVPSRSPTRASRSSGSWRWRSPTATCWWTIVAGQPAGDPGAVHPQRIAGRVEARAADGPPAARVRRATSQRLAFMAHNIVLVMQAIGSRRALLQRSEPLECARSVLEEQGMCRAGLPLRTRRSMAAPESGRA